MNRRRLYTCIFHCGDQPTQEMLFWSCKRKGSKTNEEDAYRAIARKYGIRTRKYAVIDAIWRCTEDDY